MTIRRLDVFFRTQLTLDQPQFFNSITNLALAPLQRLVGQNPFPSLKGKVSDVPQPTAVSSCYVATLFKVVVYVCDFFVAIVLTPIGIAARYMSFRSPQIDRAYSHAFLLQIHPFERTSKLMESSFAFMQKMPEEERADFLNELPDDLFFSYLSLPAHRDFAYAFLSQFPLPERTETLKKLPPFVQADFLSLDANTEFSEKYLSEITESAYFQLMPYLTEKLIKFYQTMKAEKNELEALLDDALEDFAPNISSSRLASVRIEIDLNIEEVLAGVAMMGMTSSYAKPTAEQIAEISQDVNQVIEMINLNFKSLLEHADNPGPWLEQESKNPFYCHPFAASCSLMTSLDKATYIQAHLNSALVIEWKHNYQQCVLLLKNKGLDQYIETEFSFSARCQLMMRGAEMISELIEQDPILAQQLKMAGEMLEQNPQLNNKMKKTMKSFAENPFATMDEIDQDPQLVEIRKQAMNGNRTHSVQPKPLTVQLGTTDSATQKDLLEPERKIDYFEDMNIQDPDVD